MIDLYDTDGSNTLCPEEFCNLLKAEIKERHSEKAAMHLFEKIDTDGDGAISALCLCNFLDILVDYKMIIYHWGV